MHLYVLLCGFPELEAMGHCPSGSFGPVDVLLCDDSEMTAGNVLPIRRALFS